MEQNQGEKAEREENLMCPLRVHNTIRPAQGLFRPFLKAFAAVYLDPTDRPWVSDDG